MTYYVKTVTDPAQIHNAPKTQIAVYADPEGYCPKTTAAMVYIQGKGFLTRMESDERALTAVVTEEDGDVYKDSCMEWFVNFAPEKGDYYLNFESNPFAALHCKRGKDRYVRVPLSEFGAVRPTAKAEVTKDGWAIEYFVPLATIQAVFGRDSFAPGDVLKGNFYKCSETPGHIHHGMWSEVKLPKLDFHRPDFFGEFVITE